MTPSPRDLEAAREFVEREEVGPWMCVGESVEDQREALVNATLALGKERA